MQLPHSRELELVELAEDIATDYCPGGVVDPAHICRKKEIALLHENYGEGKFDGMLVLRKGIWSIICNRDSGNSSGSPRGRFTTSHELGHFFIPEHRRQLMAGCRSHPSQAGAFDGADCIEELEADTFAANLLLPPSRLKVRLRARSMTPMQAVVKLRDEFCTSGESTAIQVMRHDSRVIAIAKWDDEKLAWPRVADSFFRDGGYRRFRLRNRADLPDECATSLALKDSPSRFDASIHETVATAAFCFEHVAVSGTRDLILREEAIRLGRFGALTIYSLR